MSEGFNSVGGVLKKQHNKIRNRIKALDSSLELRTIGSFTTFIVEGKVTCTGVRAQTQHLVHTPT